VDEQRALQKQRNKIDLCVCVGGTPAGHKNTNLWPKDPSAISARSTARRSNVRGSTVIGQNTRPLEEMKLIVDGCNRDRDGERDGERDRDRDGDRERDRERDHEGEIEGDFSDSEQSNSESCVSMCESFSFLSTEKKRPYGVIR
jgi:hypothetical protein